MDWRFGRDLGFCGAIFKTTMARETLMNGHSHHDNPNDYAEAIAAYKKSFPSAREVRSQTPDPATREMLEFFAANNLQTPFDRFDTQKPHCSFGLAGVCCKICVMGPCKITAKAPKGACGADADLIVARNLLRTIAAGVAAHGARGREVMIALKAAAQGKLDMPIASPQKVLASSKALGIAVEGRNINEIANDLADLLLEDLSRTLPSDHKTIKAFAAKERVELWEKLDILPIGAMHEVFEAFHRTSTGTDGDWRNVMKQFLRCALAFSWSSVLGSSIAMDSLFGLPKRGEMKCNLGALKEGFVNIAVHGHSPVLVSAIVQAGQSEKWQTKARELGANGIQFYGVCCSGLSAMYRYGGVIPLSNAVGAELVVGTGALDLWVADVQDVFPTIMEVANCFKTVVVTTSDSARLPGAEFYGFDRHHSNLSEAKALADKIIARSIKSYENRRNIPRHIPNYEISAEIGFSVESIAQEVGLERIVAALKSGDIIGVVNLVGCSNPRVIYEKAALQTACELIKRNALVLTNGCASFVLMKAGLCAVKGAQMAGEGLQKFLAGKLPPIWHFGECLDNARASALFKALAALADKPIKDMPFAFASPEWSNEKGLGASSAFRVLGMNSYHCVYPPVQGSSAVSDWLYRESGETLGGVMRVNLDPIALAEEIALDLKTKRANAFV
ncbi:MAG: anaerobic carbon-monoxide dehydrogenase catalytic subunit [Helicobacteraceae bacterium]|nr:anaerobic carbon-monoxide dehydrogenase catalytic subunit [Helicobacteraceae bacterium]